MIRKLAIPVLAALVASLTMLPARADAPGTIVDVAAANGQFNTLVAAVKAAGLASTLAGPGPFTVFAPTDAAFAALPGHGRHALETRKQGQASRNSALPRRLG